MSEEATDTNMYGFKQYDFQIVTPASGEVPSPRSGQRIVHSPDDRYIYMYGGFNDNGEQMERHHRINPSWIITRPLFEELWRFCKLTKRWQLLHPEGPSPAHPASACMALVDANTLLVYGGSGFPFAQRNSNKTYVCDLTKLRWEQLSYVGTDGWGKKPPKERYGQAVLFDQGQLYVCGGTDGYRFAIEIHRLNLKTRKWTKLGADPGGEYFQPRYRHELAKWDNKLYIVGGGTMTSSCPTQKIPCFDLSLKRWEVAETKPAEVVNPETGSIELIYPEGRYSHGGGQRGSRVYVCGGVDYGRKIFSDLWWLDLSDMRWHRVDTPGVQTGHATYFQGADISPRGELITFGGVTSITTKLRTNQMRSMWLEVPSLQKMAYDATVLQLNPKHRKDLELSPDGDQTTSLSIEDIVDHFARNGIHAKHLQLLVSELSDYTPR